MSKRCVNRSLDQLERAAELAVRLGQQAGDSKGRVGALRKRLQQLGAELRDWRKLQPLDRRRSRQKADRLFRLTVECVEAVIAALSVET
jgi:hypothetical protein